MPAPNVLGMRWQQQWMGGGGTDGEAAAWLAWMIRSKDSLSRLFSHCSLTTTRSPCAHSNRRASPFPPPWPFPLFACTGRSAMSSARCCLCWLCACLVVVTGVWAALPACGRRWQRERALSVSLLFWNFRRLSHIPSLTTPPLILPTSSCHHLVHHTSRAYPCTRAVPHRQ